MTIAKIPPRRPLAEEVNQCVFLARLIEHWGHPTMRRVYRNRKGLPTIDIYSFAGEKKSKLHRFATFGVSEVCKKAQKKNRVELFFVLPKDLGGARDSDVADYLMDIAHHAAKPQFEFREGDVFAEGPLAPKRWHAKGLLFDQASGEPECLESIQVCDGKVTLVWTVPIYQSEAVMIREEGIEAWDKACQKSDLSPVDPNRPPFT